jgi:hypothetical protein
MADGTNLEAFAVQFTKLVQILEQVRIDKDINVDVWVQGNSALADSKAEAFGPNSVAETLTLTQVVQGIGSHSISEAMSATTGSDWHWN